MKITIQSAIKGILLLQLGLAGLLLVGEFAPASPQLFAPRSPSLDRPVLPGDQTRRYTQDVPDAPDRPYAMPTGLPDHLTLQDVTDQPDALALIGGVDAGGADRIITALKDAAPSKLYLNSPGGSVDDALRLGRYLRGAGIDTVVAQGDVCLSACPYIFAGGAARRADGTLGVHQHSFGQNTYLPAFLAVEDIQRGQSQVMAYLDDMGLDVRVMTHALATGPQDIYVLLPEELAQYKVVTP